jgi:Cdc6-like AAA superfamily ATPase
MPTNPFSNSRVDNPFQDHIDLDSLNHQQFARLETILKDIKNDNNHQTKGAVIIGEAGSGKTHLIMRLAKTHLKSNRLLFIRCPNNPDGVIYHIYSRILESLMEMVDDRYNQLDYLIAKSFGNIWNEMVLEQRQTAISERISKIIEKNPLDIFDSLEKEGAKKNLDHWGFIEKKFNEWANKHFATGNHSILKALVKQTRYTDTNYKELVRRYIYLHELEENELEKIGLPDISSMENQEELALNAIKVLAQLSLMDEPLIMVFDQLESLGESYAHETLLSFGSALREIFTQIPNSLVILNLFPDRWQHFKNRFDNSIIERIGQSEIILETPNQQILKDIVLQRANKVEIDISKVFQSEDWQKILIQSTIRSALNWAANYYRFRVENIPLPITFKSFEEEMREEITILKNRVFELEQKLFTESSSIVVEIPELKLHELPPILQPTLPIEKPKSISKKEVKIDLEKQLQNYLQHHQLILEQNYEKLTIIDDNDDIGKLRLILENFKEISDFDLDVARLGKSVLPANIEIHTKQWVVVIGFLQMSATYFTNRIKHFNELVINNKDVYFRLYRDIRQPQITGKVGKEEIEKLKNSKKGDFILLEKEQRIQLELFYQLINDIINKDQEFPLKETLEFLKTHYKEHFLIKILFGTRRSF